MICNIQITGLTIIIILYIYTLVYMYIIKDTVYIGKYIL